MKVALTGAGGFIGSVVLRALRDAGHDVRAHRGAPGDVTAPIPRGVEAVDADITDEVALAGLMRETDACIHLAGPASVAASFASPTAFATAHVVGTAAVVRAAGAAKVARLVYVSSAEVYGRPTVDPVPESASLAPRSPYGAAKVGAEATVAAAVCGGSIESCAILRPFSIYGPHQRPNSLLGTIVRQATTEDAVVLDDLRPERDYCFVDDVAAAMVAACEASFEGVEIANVGSGVAVSVGVLARTAVAAAGRDIPVHERGATRPSQAEIHRLVADVSAARALLGWTAKVDLAEGLGRCFQSAVLA